MGRRLGQHFLFDPAILDRIVDALEPSDKDVVIEIGPGVGTLTERLAARVRRVIAIEKDRELVSRLRERGNDREAGSGKRETLASLPGNVSVIEGDALELDWHQLIVAAVQGDEPGGAGPLPVSRFPFLGGFKIIGNIPYAITSPLIEKALTPPLPGVVVFLVQREVADRVAAEPGSKVYGGLSVGVQTVARAERLLTVRAGAFKPPPKVDSAVVRFTPLSDPLVAPGEHAEFRRFVTALFGRRRKQLGGAIRGVTGRERADVEAELVRLGIEPTVRCETLPPADFVRLFGAFAQ